MRVAEAGCKAPLGPLDRPRRLLRTGGGAVQDPECGCLQRVDVGSGGRRRRGRGSCGSDGGLRVCFGVGDTPDRGGRAFAFPLGRRWVGAEREGLLPLWVMTAWGCARDD
jgi:hypothetical protein